jgi:ABC-type long-subunit fatty acid transport system fused permease/ATPase subunit
MFTKKYFQDRPILFLNLIVILGALINVISTVLRIDASQKIVILRYQVALGLAGFQRGDVLQLYSFALAALLMAIVAILISARLYHQRRALSILILSLTIVALFFNLVVSDAILKLQ